MSISLSIGIYHVPQSPLLRGKGNIWPISGYIKGDLNSIQNIRIQINDKIERVHELFQVPFGVEGIDFFGSMLLPEVINFSHFIYSHFEIDDLLTISLLIQTTSNQDLVLPVSTFEVYERVETHPTQLPLAKIAICMTTFEPNPVLFKRQIESIKNQQLKNWILVISDDFSSLESFQFIKQMSDTDDRIFLFRNSKNLGFYQNFEHCLNLLPNQSDYIALSDQDDVWYPMKLESLMKNIGSNSLIYNDMSIKNENGELIASTFWDDRTNHFTDVQSLFIANTVTGSASLFNANLLSKLLPFPVRLGNAFHDHWLGLVASFHHGIAYWPEVQQEYIQHKGNVTGFEHFNALNIRHSSLSLLSLQRMKAAVALKLSSTKTQKFIKNNLKVYFDGYMRRKLQYHILLSRFPHGHREPLDKMFGPKEDSVQQLLLQHVRIYKNKWRTNNAELSYINAIEVMKQMRVKY